MYVIYTLGTQGVPTQYQNSGFGDIHCDVAIIGGGVAGTYLAMRLGEERSNICLFEKESKLGGRCETIETKDNFNRPTHIGIGARRILKKGACKYAEDLAHELNITLE